MIHLHGATKHMLADWRVNGVSGIWFEQLNLSTPRQQDWLDDGYTEQEYREHMRDCVHFVAQPRVEMPEAENEFQHFVFDERAMLERIQAEIRKWLGDDVTIGYSEGCFEYEVQRQPAVTTG